MNYCFHGSPAHLCRQCVVDERDAARFVAREARQLLVEFEANADVAIWMATREINHPWLSEEEQRR